MMICWRCNICDPDTAHLIEVSTRLTVEAAYGIVLEDHGIVSPKCEATAARLGYPPSYLGIAVDFLIRRVQ